MSSAQPRFHRPERLAFHRGSDEAASAPDPGAGGPAIPWACVLHDVRGAATAIESLARLVSDDAKALDPGSRGLLGLIQARAEQLGALCEAVALLALEPSRRLPLADIMALSLRRLQNFLDRSAVSLKSLGEIPDREFEARPLGVLIQSILVASVNCRDSSRQATLQVEVDVVNDTTRIALALIGSGWGRPSCEAVRELGSREPSSGRATTHVAARHALQRLGASIECFADGEGDGEGARVVVSLPPAAWDTP